MGGAGLDSRIGGSEDGACSVPIRFFVVIYAPIHQEKQVETTLLSRKVKSIRNHFHAFSLL